MAYRGGGASVLPPLSRVVGGVDRAVILLVEGTGVLLGEGQLVGTDMDLLEMLLHLRGSVVLRYVWSVFLPADGAIVQHTVLEQHPLLTPVIRPVRSVAGWDYVDTLGVGRVDANRVDAQTRCPEGPVDPPIVPLRGSVQPRHLRPAFSAVA